MENLTGGTPPVRYLPCVVPCKLYFPDCKTTPTVTEERAQEVDFALPYTNVALGVVSPDSAVITSLDEIGAEDEVIVISGTTAETYLEKNYPNIKLQKYDAYADRDP